MEQTQRQQQVQMAFWCCFYAGGIILTLVIYGVLQERIMDHPYGAKEMFQDSVFLVFLNRVAAVVFALIMTIIRGESLMWVAPLWKYIAISLSNVYASTCQYEALKYVSFPVQQLGKSFKMMPVMVWGIIISRRQYKLADWLVALAVTGGVTTFLLTGPIKSEHGDARTSIHGLLLLMGFLLLDGFTSNYQEVLFKEYKTTKYNQMIYVNGASSVVSFVTALASGGLARSIAFIGHHPVFLADASMLSASAVAGQWFIYSQVKEFGALVFAATMNVRQVISMNMSYYKYGHSITLPQILALVVVFGALFSKAFKGFMAEGKKEEKQPLIKKDVEEEPIKEVPDQASAKV